MSKPHSPSDRARAERRLAGEPAQSATSPTAPRRPSWAVGVVIAVLAVAAAGVYCFTRDRGAPPAASPELEVCRRFMALKNAKDAAANDLLGPAPVVPASAVTPQEAEALHAEFFLRGDYEVVSVRPEAGDAAGPGAGFVLALRGGVTSPRIPQTSADGVEVFNRSTANPDVIVRVEGNRLRAVSAGLHEDPDAKPMSPEDARRLLIGK